MGMLKDCQDPPPVRNLPTLHPVGPGDSSDDSDDPDEGGAALFGRGAQRLGRQSGTASASAQEGVQQFAKHYGPVCAARNLDPSHLVTTLPKPLVIPKKQGTKKNGKKKNGNKKGGNKTKKKIGTDAKQNQTAHDAIPKKNNERITHDREVPSATDSVDLSRKKTDTGTPTAEGAFPKSDMLWNDPIEEAIKDSLLDMPSLVKGLDSVTVPRSKKQKGGKNGMPPASLVESGGPTPSPSIVMSDVSLSTPRTEGPLVGVTDPNVFRRMRKRATDLVRLVPIDYWPKPVEHTAEASEEGSIDETPL